tara:strand:+ start:441 stop:638 length:198 start_codon:yes stop_codon:yes gene_type:complete
MKEGEKKHAGMIVALSQVINSMRNDQYGGKRKTRGKKEEKKRNTKPKREKKERRKKQKKDLEIKV